MGRYAFNILYIRVERMFEVEAKPSRERNEFRYVDPFLRPIFFCDSIHLSFFPLQLTTRHPLRLTSPMSARIVYKDKRTSSHIHWLYSLSASS
jgi:hypothetical protein